MPGAPGITNKRRQPAASIKNIKKHEDRREPAFPAERVDRSGQVPGGPERSGSCPRERAHPVPVVRVNSVRDRNPEGRNNLLVRWSAKRGIKRPDSLNEDLTRNPGNALAVILLTYYPFDVNLERSNPASKAKPKIARDSAYFHQNLQ